MRKIIYYLTNGMATGEDKHKRHDMMKDGSKVFFSNGSVQHGFQDKCDAVYLSADFPHVESWAISAGLEVIKPVVAEETESVDESEPVKRGRKPKTETE